VSGTVPERFPRTGPPDADDRVRAAGARDSPYKGLTPYSEEDAAYFFGREAEREIITANLMASRLTVLYGASGVGKSSILRAGVKRDLERLAQRNRRERGVPELAPLAFSAWREEDVSRALASAVREAVVAVGIDAVPEPLPSLSLAEQLAVYAEVVGGELLVILDQFEEYFLYHPRVAGGFDIELARAITRPDLRANFLIAIREDALAGLDRFKGLIPQLLDNYLRLRHLDRSAARMAMTKPLEQFNVQRVAELSPVSIEPELVEAVLDQVKTGQVRLEQGGAGGVGTATGGAVDQSIETPYLQLVMSRLWEEELGAGSHMLRLETLERLGGAARIVSAHLDQAMSELSARERDLAAGIFHYLVTPSGAKVAHALPDLADYAGASPSELEPMLERLSYGSARILRPVADETGRESVASYEIFHDVLAAPILDWRQRHVAAMQRAQAEEKRREAEQRLHEERRKSRIFRTVAVVAGLLAVGVGVLAVVVIRASHKTHSRELAASAISDLSVDPSESLRLATQAVGVSDTPEAEVALRRSLEDSRLRVVMLGHRDWVNKAAYSPDGRRIVTASNDGTARVWDARTGRPISTLRTGSAPLSVVTFDRGGGLVFAAGADGRVRVWDGRSRRALRTLNPGAGPLDSNSVAFSTASDRIITPSGAAAAVVWDARAGTRLRVARGQKVDAVAIRDDGHQVATGGPDGTVRVSDARTGTLTRSLRLPGQIVIVQLSPDGRRLLACTPDTAYLQILGRRGRRVALHTYPNVGLESARFSPDGRWIVTAGDRDAHVFSSATGKQVGFLHGHGDLVTSAAFSPAGRLVVTSSQDGSARVWSRSGGTLAELHGHTDAVRGAAFNPDGRSVVTAGADRTARVWSVVRETVLYARGTVTSAEFSRDGRRVLTSSADGTARLWDTDGRTLATLGSGRDLGALTVADLSPDGGRIATVGLRSGLQVWAVRSGRRARPLFPPKQTGAPPSDADFSPDGRYVVTAGYNPQAQIRDSRSGRLVTRLVGHGDEVLTAAFSPDGGHIVTASVDRTARIWRASDGRQLLVLRGHAGIVWSADWSSDGTRVVTAGNDGTVRIWDASTGRSLRVFRGFAGAFRSAAFSPDGHWVVAAGNDGTTRIWDAASEQPLAVMHRHADAINAASFGPDGVTILTAGDDLTAKLYRCDTCASLGRLKQLAAAEQRYVRRASSG
jgi:WD40 repeat protein